MINSLQNRNEIFIPRKNEILLSIVKLKAKHLMLKGRVYNKMKWSTHPPTTQTQLTG